MGLLDSSLGQRQQPTCFNLHFDIRKSLKFVGPAYTYSRQIGKKIDNLTTRLAQRLNDWELHLHYGSRFDPRTEQVFV